MEHDLQDTVLDGQLHRSRLCPRRPASHFHVISHRCPYRRHRPEVSGVEAELRLVLILIAWQCKGIGKRQALRVHSPVLIPEDTTVRPHSGRRPRHGRRFPPERLPGPALPACIDRRLRWPGEERPARRRSPRNLPYGAPASPREKARSPPGRSMLYPLYIARILRHNPRFSRL